MADNNSSSMIVAIVAIVVIIGLGFLALRMFGGDMNGDAGNGTPSLDVNVGTNGQ
jgi:hypothetical protein